MRPHTLPTFALATALASSGCLTLARMTNGGGTETEMSRSRAARYDGPDCARVLYQLDELDSSDYNAKDTTVDNSREAQILLAICTRRSKVGTYGHDIPQWPRFSELDAIAVYKVYDDLRREPVLPALAAVQIANDQASKSYAQPSKQQVGLALFWATVVSEAELARGLEQVQLPPEARAAFVTLFTSVHSRLSGVLTPAERELLVDLPAAVFQNRQDHFAAYQPMYAELDRLQVDAIAARTADQKIAPTVAGLERLRSQFAARCGAIECRSMPLYAVASAELAQLHVLRGDTLRARVESWHNARSGGFVAGLSQAIRVAQEAYVAGNKQALAKYKNAVEHGADAQTAAKLAGRTPQQDFDHDLLIEPETNLPDYSAALDDKADQRMADNAFVSSVRGAGKTRTIVFRKNKFTTDEEYGCKRTNRVIRIQSDGTLEYEENCKYRARTHIQDQHAPIEVPAAEAAHLRAGDLVVFASDGTAAYVLEVKRNDKLVQVRGDWFGA
jgi:hypothetical protein